MRMLTAVLIFASLTLTYALLTAHFPTLEDDGLFILGAWDMGTAHAPGYPLFILLSQPFLLLPFGTVAFKVHLLNGVLAALTCTLLFLYLTRQLRIPDKIALTSSVCLAFSGLFFSQALIAEAYMLNVFLLVCLLWLPAAGFPVNHRFLLAGLLYGLALSNHWPLTLLVSPALIAVYWPMLIGLRQAFVTPLLSAIAGLVLGLLPYLWMYLSAADDKFSHMGAFYSFKDFLGFILRDVYANVDQSNLATGADKRLFLESYVLGAATQFGILVLPLIFAGFIRQWRVLSIHQATGLSLFLALPLGLVALLNFPYQSAYVAASLAYPLPLYLVMAIWLGLGMNWLCEHLPRPAHPIVGLLLIAVTLQQNRQVPEENDSRWSRDIAMQIVYSLPEDAVLIVSNNWSMAQVSYLHYVEGVRPDITLVSEYGTFLPDRFSYWLPDEQKVAMLEELVSSETRQIYSLAPLRMMQAPATDLGLVYSLDNQLNLDIQLNMVSAKGPVSQIPKGTWNQLYWQELLVRNIEQFSFDEVEQINNVQMKLAFSQHLMKTAFHPEQVARLLTSLDSVISNENRFDQARHATLKGDLMALTDNDELAAEFYRLAREKLPTATVRDRVSKSG